MAINLKSTSSVTAQGGVKILVYGKSGCGKTHLIQTLPAPVILSAEGGMLTLRNREIPFIEIADRAQLIEALNWCRDSVESKQFESIALDSISEIAEVILNSEKKKTKDPRQAYGAMAEQMADIVRDFRNLQDRNIYFVAKAERIVDDKSAIQWSPSMPGKQTAQAIPYFFDEVFALRAEKDADGNIQRALQTADDGQWLAKDRSGVLDFWEAPDLGLIIKKIIGGVQDE
jgi:hypothetical protein